MLQATWEEGCVQMQVQVEWNDLDTHCAVLPIATN